MRNRILAALAGLMLLLGVGFASATTSVATPATPQQRAVAMGLPAGSAVYTAAEFAALPAAHPVVLSAAVKPYDKKNCWAGNEGINVEISNWGRSDGWQVYHVWLYKASWETWVGGHYMDSVLKETITSAGTKEYYINVPDQAVHRQGARAASSVSRLATNYAWCAFYL